MIDQPREPISTHLTTRLPLSARRSISPTSQIHAEGGHIYNGTKISRIQHTHKKTKKKKTSYTIPSNPHSRTHKKERTPPTLQTIKLTTVLQIQVHMHEKRVEKRKKTTRKEKQQLKKTIRSGYRHVNIEPSSLLMIWVSNFFRSCFPFVDTVGRDRRGRE